MISRIILTIFQVVSGIWLGIFFVALNSPNSYQYLFSGLSTVIAALIAVIGGLIGLDKYRKEREFKLSMELPFSRIILDKQKEFYEQYTKQIEELEKLIGKYGLNLSTQPSDEFSLLKNFIHNLRKEFEKWLSESQIEIIRKTEQDFFKLYADAWIINSSERKEEPSGEWSILVENHDNNISNLINGGLDAWRAELKKEFFVNAIVGMQDRIIQESSEGHK